MGGLPRKQTNAVQFRVILNDYHTLIGAGLFFVNSDSHVTHIASKLTSHDTMIQ